MRRAILRVVQELRGVARTIESDHDSLAHHKGLVLVLEPYSTLEVVQIRLDRVLDGLPSCLRWFDVSPWLRTSAHVVPVERLDSTEDMVCHDLERHGRE